MNSITRKRLITAVILGAHVSLMGAQAEEPEENSQVSQAELSAVEVTALRNKSIEGQTPQKVSIIDREQIERQLAISSDRGQILANLIPGYSPSRQKMTNSGETFRGRSPLFLIDGVPQSNPVRDSSRDSYTIDLSMVERIEVIHGASAVHGLGATGGIINFVTKRAAPGTFNQHASVSLTTDDDFSSDGLGHKLSYQFNGQQGNWDYLAAITQQDRGIFYDGDDRRVGFDTIQGEIQDSSSYDLFARLGYWIDDRQNIDFSINRFELENDGDYVPVAGDRSAGISTTSERGTPEGESAYNEVTTTSLSYTHADWLGNEVKLQAYNQRFRAQFGTHPFAFPYFDENGNQRLDQSRNESDKIGMKLTLNRTGLFDGFLDLTTGVDLIQDETEQVLVQTGRTYVPETKFNNYAGFLQGTLNLSDSLSLHSGLRYEYAKLDVDTFQTIDRSDVNQDLVSVDGGKPSFDEPLFNIGLVYQATSWAQLFANYSEGFGLPDVGRALRGIDEPNRDVDNLLELRPILTDNIEVGTRIDWHPLSLEVSYYRSDSDLGQRLTEENGVFVGNREKTEIEGVELSSQLAISDSHKLTAAYAHSEGESDTDGDGRVDRELGGINIAPDRLTLGWNAGWIPKMATTLQISHFFNRDFDDEENPNLDKFNGYSLVDALITYELPVGRMSFATQNLFDEDYFTYYSQTARDGDEQYFKGRGRTFTLGYQVNF